MPSYCCAYGCKNNSTSNNISFHSFPLKNVKLTKEWVSRIKRHPFKVTSYTKICSEHFEADCFETGTFSSRKRLKPDAVPTKFCFSKDKNARTRKSLRFKMNYYGYRLSYPHEFDFPVDVQTHPLTPIYGYNREPQSLDQLLSWPFLYRNLLVVQRILRYVTPVTIDWKDLRSYISYVRSSICWQDLFMDHIQVVHWNFKDDLMLGKRLKLIVMAIDFVLQVRIQNCQDSIKGLRLLFQAISDPLVTWFEIFGFLAGRFTLWPTENNDSYIESFMESCMRYYPECFQEHKPRSLKHLARCEVRKCLGRAHSLPHGVWGLGLPRELEDYVLLQTRKDEFRPVIRPLSSEKVFVVGPELDVQSPETLGLGRS